MFGNHGQWDDSCDCNDSYNFEITDIVKNVVVLETKHDIDIYMLSSNKQIIIKWLHYKNGDQDNYIYFDKDKGILFIKKNLTNGT